jgi:hypothetical protein
MSTPISIQTLLDGPVTLQLECIDRLYLHGYVPRLQTGGGLSSFLSEHRRHPIASPARLQALANSLSPTQVQAFLDRWLERLPLPLSESDREAGFDYELSIWQMELSLTQVLDRPLAGRRCFEEVIRDNLDLGRPDRVQLLFPRKIRRRAPGRFRTGVIQQGVHPSLHIEYKHFDLKQDFKEGRALRTEGTFRDAKHFDWKKGLENLPLLQQRGRQVNRRLLEVERASHNCGVSAACIQSVVQPTVTQDGQRASGLKLGDLRVMALMLALTMFGFLVHGFRNRELREKVAALLGCPLAEDSAARMSYDLRRLRHKGLLLRAEDSHRYYLTWEGWNLARLYARLEARAFRPLLTVLEGSVHGLPPPLERALDAVDDELDQLLEGAIPMKKAA